MKNYTAIDRFFNRFRKNGIWVYTGLVLFLTLYAWYSLNHLPTIPKRLKDKKSKSPDLEKDNEYKLHHLHEGETGVKLRLNLFHSVVPKDDGDVHVVDTWDKQQLFTYLLDYRIFPDIDADIDQVRLQAKEVYNQAKA